MALRFTRKGEIHIGPDVVITPRLTRSAFLAEFGGRSKPWSGRTDRESYAISPVESDGVWLYATLGFQREALLELGLGVSRLAPEQSAWEHWSLEEEAASKRYLEHALLASLGSPHVGKVNTSAPLQEFLDYSIGYTFLWGIVDVFYDAKAAGTKLLVQYRRLWRMLPR